MGFQAAQLEQTQHTNHVHNNRAQGRENNYFGGCARKQGQKTHYSTRHQRPVRSLFKLRRLEPHADRPFVAPFYPYFPIVALVLSLVSMVAIVYYNPGLSALFFVPLGVSLLIFQLWGRKHVKPILKDQDV